VPRVKPKRTFEISWLSGIVGCSLTVECSEIEKLDAHSVSVDGAVLHLGYITNITNISRRGW
jgi:hypothetical protein